MSQSGLYDTRTDLRNCTVATFTFDVEDLSGVPVLTDDPSGIVKSVSGGGGLYTVELKDVYTTISPTANVYDAAFIGVVIAVDPSSSVFRIATLETVAMSIPQPAPVGTLVNVTVILGA